MQQTTPPTHPSPLLRGPAKSEGYFLLQATRPQETAAKSGLRPARRQLTTAAALPDGLSLRPFLSYCTSQKVVVALVRAVTCRRHAPLKYTFG